MSEFQVFAAKYCEMLIFQTKTVLMNTSIPERKKISTGVANNEKPSQECDMESQASESEESNKNFS